MRYGVLTWLNSTRHLHAGLSNAARAGLKSLSTLAGAPCPQSSFARTIRVRAVVPMARCLLLKLYQ